MKFIFMVLAGSLSIFSAVGQDLPKQIPVSKDSSAEESASERQDLSEVTVSATRFAENKKYLAQQVFTISRRMIRSANQPSTADLLSQTGQVLVQKSQLGGGSPIIRGFEANKVLLSVDGVRMNNAIYRGGHLQNVITLNDESLESIEILFGPSSVMYGSDALGGVISFFTKNPEFTDKKSLTGSATARYATVYEGLHLHAEARAGSPRFASYSSFSYSKFGNLRQGRKKYDDFPHWGDDSINVETIDGRDTIVSNPHPDRQTPTGYSQYDAVQKFLFFTGGVRNTVNVQFSTSTDIPRYDRLTEVNSSGIPKSAEWYYGPQQRWLIAWQLDLKATRIYDQARIIPAFQKILESRHNRNFGSTSLKNRHEKVMVYSLNADFKKKIERAEWNYGLDLSMNRVESNANTLDIVTGETRPLDTRYPDGGSRTFQAAVYGAWLYKINNNWVINSGIRYNVSSLHSTFHDTSFFSFPFTEINQKSDVLTGSLGLNWLPKQDWKCSLLFSTGFRTPNVDDISKVFESRPGILIVPNPSLKPEQSNNFEAGISKTWGSKAQIMLSGWYTRFRDILTSDSSVFNGQPIIDYEGIPSRVMTAVNKNKAELFGWSARINLEPGNRFFLYSTIQYTYGSVKDSGSSYPLDHIPPMYGKLSAGKRFNRFNAEIFALWNGTKDSSRYNRLGEDNQIYSADPVRGYTPAWFTLNLHTELKINSLYSLQFDIENIFDRYYRVFASGISGPGRNFVITIRGKLP